MIRGAFGKWHVTYRGLARLGNEFQGSDNFPICEVGRPFTAGTDFTLAESSGVGDNGPVST